MNTSEQHKATRGSCLLDLFLRPVSSDHTDFITKYLTIIPRARMSSNGLLTQRPDGKRNNRFSKIQRIGQKYPGKKILAS